MNDPLLEPFDLAGLRLRNRVFSSSHSPGYNVDGTPSDRYVRYHEEKALGGIGLTMIGGSSNVSIDSASLWGQLSFATDAVIDPLAVMVERIHGHGAAIMCQLTHMGRRNVSNDGAWLPTIAPSPVREPMHRFWPKEAEPADLERLVADFAMATRRAVDAGLDGIELLATVPYGIDQATAAGLLEHAVADIQRTIREMRTEPPPIEHYEHEPRSGINGARGDHI